jgi:hypothetical protein
MPFVQPTESNIVDVDGAGLLLHSLIRDEAEQRVLHRHCADRMWQIP